MPKFLSSAINRYRTSVQKVLAGTGVSEKRYALQSLGILLLGTILGLFLYRSLLIGLAMGVGFIYLEFLAYTLKNNDRNRMYIQQLEVYMSLVTASYLRTDSLLLAVCENLTRFDSGSEAARPFFLYHTLASYVNASQSACILGMSSESSNIHFKQWCSKLILCQEDVSLKYTLEPQLLRMRQIRNLDSELQSIMAKDNATFIAIVLLSSLLLFGVPMLQPDLKYVLVETTIGKILAFTALGVLFLSCGMVVRANRAFGGES